MPNRRGLRKYYYKGKRMPVWAVNPNPGLRAIAQSASTALKVAKSVKRMLNVEYKVTDTVLTASGGAGAGIDDAGEVHDLLQIAQGDGQTHRDGNSVRVKSLNIKGGISLGGAATFTKAKVLIVRDSQPNGSTPTFTTIFENSVMSRLYMNRTYPGRFKVVASRDLKLSTEGGHNEVFFDIYMKLNDKILWQSGATADPYNTNYLLCLIADQSTNEPAFSIASRCKFVDN